MVELNTTILAIILNENGLNALIKRHIVSIRKEIRPSYILLARDRDIRTQIQQKQKDWKKTQHAKVKEC